VSQIMCAIAAVSEARAPEKPRLQALEGRYRQAPARLAQEDGLARLRHPLTEVLQEDGAQGSGHRQQASLSAFPADSHHSTMTVGAPVYVPAVEPDELALAEAGAKECQKEGPLAVGHRHAQEYFQVFLRDRLGFRSGHARLVHFIHWVSWDDPHPNVA
jgi:hypothetical protein